MAPALASIGGTGRPLTKSPRVQPLRLSPLRAAVNQLPAATTAAAMPTKTGPLTMAVIRLLSIALEAPTPSGVRAIAGPALPAGFHAWPYHESDLDHTTVLRCYVSPRTVMAEEPHTFPIGTTLVVERRSTAERSSERRPLTRGGAQARVESRFVMVKCATVTAGIGGDHDVWMHASYRAADVDMRPSLPMCGVIRVSVDAQDTTGAHH